MVQQSYIYSRLYLGPHDFPDGRVELHRVVVVHCHDVRSADVLLCIWVLRGHLQGNTHSQSSTSKRLQKMQTEEFLTFIFNTLRKIKHIPAIKLPERYIFGHRARKLTVCTLTPNNGLQQFHCSCVTACTQLYKRKSCCIRITVHQPVIRHDRLSVPTVHARTVQKLKSEAAGSVTVGVRAVKWKQHSCTFIQHI